MSSETLIPPVPVTPTERVEKAAPVPPPAATGTTRERDERFREKQPEERRADIVRTVTGFKDASRGKLIIEEDEETGRYVQKIVDTDTGETIRQFPDEDFLKVVKSLGDAYGIWVDRYI